MSWTCKRFWSLDLISRPLWPVSSCRSVCATAPPQPMRSGTFAWQKLHPNIHQIHSKITKNIIISRIRNLDRIGSPRPKSLKCFNSVVRHRLRESAIPKDFPQRIVTMKYSRVHLSIIYIYILLYILDRYIIHPVSALAEKSSKPPRAKQHVSNQKRGGAVVTWD